MRFLLLIFIFFLLGCSPKPVGPGAKATALVTQLSRGEFAQATAAFDPTVKAALPADKLRALWTQLQKQAGKLQSIDPAREEKAAGLDAVFVPCRFEKAVVEVKVVFDAKGLVTGLFFVPPGGR